jgi:hypothetical protein
MTPGERATATAVFNTETKKRRLRQKGQPLEPPLTEPSETTHTLPEEIGPSEETEATIPVESRELVEQIAPATGNSPTKNQIENLQQLSVALDKLHAIDKVTSQDYEDEKEDDINEFELALMYAGLDYDN